MTSTKDVEYDSTQSHLSKLNQYESTESLIPEGWKEITHDSGIRCYVHPPSKTICWSRPYRMNHHEHTDFDATVRSHLPPLDIFRSSNETDTHEPRNSANLDTNDATMKRNTICGRMMDVHDVANTILVNGVRIENPEGKSAKALLRDYIVAALRCTPRYVFYKTDDLMNPVKCVIFVHEKQYSSESRPSKVLAREAAVEAALEKIIPGFQELLVKKDVHMQDKSGECADQVMAACHSKAMSLEDFKQLSMKDDRVLSSCLALSIRTPAQVLQEYQNRNRGVSINYNTIISVDHNGSNIFKTIASCGRKSGEGVASTKRISKQFAAQALLARLHEHSPYKSYYDIADLYSSLAKSVPTNTVHPEVFTKDSDKEITKRQRLSNSPSRDEVLNTESWSVTEGEEDRYRVVEYEHRDERSQRYGYSRRSPPSRHKVNHRSHATYY